MKEPIKRHWCDCTQPWGVEHWTFAREGETGVSEYVGVVTSVVKMKQGHSGLDATTPLKGRARA